MAAVWAMPFSRARRRQSGARSGAEGESEHDAKQKALPAACPGRARVCRASPVRFENVRPSGAHGVCIFEHVAEARREERSKRRELRRLAVLSFLSSLPQGMSVDARRNEWRRRTCGSWAAVQALPFSPCASGGAGVGGCRLRSLHAALDQVQRKRLCLRPAVCVLGSRMERESALFDGTRRGRGESPRLEMVVAWGGCPFFWWSVARESFLLKMALDSV